MSPVMAAAGGLAHKKKRWLLGGLLVQFAVLTASIFLGWIKEKKN